MPARRKPETPGRKLHGIRKFLGASQSEMLRLLKFQVSIARVSEYERGIREPNLLVLLAYARAAHVPVENLIDDDLDLFD